MNLNVCACVYIYIYIYIYIYEIHSKSFKPHQDVSKSIGAESKKFGVYQFLAFGNFPQHMDVPVLVDQEEHTSNSIKQT